METRDVPPTDETLVLGVLHGDRSAFAELYDRRARLIRAVCYDATRDVHLAADLTQEVFLRAFRRLGTLRDRQRFTAWLTGIARQVCREWRRERRRDRNLLSNLPDEVVCTDPFDEPDDRIAAIRDALASLPEKERLALHAFYLRGLDVDEARTVLGLSRSGLYRLLSCARGRLTRLMSRKEVAP